MLAAIFGLGPVELIIIIAVIALLFAPAILPRLIRRVGDSVSAMREMTDNFEKEKNEDENEPKAKKSKK